MKRNEIIIELVKEGLSEKTLANFTDNQIKSLAERMLGEQMTTAAKGVTYLDSKDPMAAQKAKSLNSQGVNTKMEEELIGKQKNIDKNHNGKIDSQDFKILQRQKKKKNIDEKDKGNLIKTKKTIYDKALKDLGGEDGVIKFLEKGMKGKKKNKKDKKVEASETKNWVLGIVENKYFHNFTSKGEIMELITSKLNEQAIEEKVVLPDFLTSKAIKGAQNNEDKEAPVTKPKPTTKPDTKPGKPKHTPFNPGPKPNPGPQAEAKK